MGRVRRDRLWRGVGRRRALIGATALVLVVAAACVGGPPPPPPPPPDPLPAAPTPPVLNHDFPDPNVVRDSDNSVFRAYSTNVGLTMIPTVSSAGVGGPWQPAPTEPSNPNQCCYGYPNTANGGDALSARPSWDTTSDLGTVWAPAIWHNPNGQWLMYFTDRYQGGSQCIGVATASTARGPYAPQGASPVVCQTSLGGSIDPSVFVEGGQAWLLWKNDGNCCGIATRLWSQRLSTDGLSVTGSPTALISVSQGWENGDAGGEPFKTVIEAPAMVHSGSSYYLFYSANWWESANYAIGYAVCTAPAGSCSKPRNGPIMASGSQGSGPGGEDVFDDGTGQLWMAYHAWTPNLVGYQPMTNPNWAAYKRSLRFTRISLAGGITFGGGP